MKNILVLCTGNSCRSQMMQGYLQNLAGNKAKIYSAGLETHGVNPTAVKVMKDDGVDISHHTSNSIDEYKGMEFEVVLTVCDHVREHCPWFPSRADMVHQSFEDPAKATGSDEEVLNKFREVRDQIREYAKIFVNKYIG